MFHQKIDHHSWHPTSQVKKKQHFFRYCDAVSGDGTTHHKDIIWVWVKIRYPNNWIVNTKVFHFDPHPFVMNQTVLNHSFRGEHSCGDLKDLSYPVYQSTHFSPRFTCWLNQGTTTQPCFSVTNGDIFPEKITNRPSLYHPYLYTYAYLYI